MSTAAEINYKMVILARESRGKTQKELAEELGITQGKLSKVENGLQGITEEMIIGLPKILNYPIEFFSQKENIYNLSGVHYRKRVITKKDLLKSEALVNISRINVEKLLKSVEIPECDYPKFDLEVDGTPESCADYLREYWRIPKGRIENLTKLIEDHGILLISMDFQDIKIDGLSAISDSGQPIIFMNKYMPGDRQRTTLAHELGHIIMHLHCYCPQSRDTETEAFLFAAALLMPEREIKSQLVRLNLNKLAELKMYWKVSMGSLLVRAKHIGAITEDQSKYMWMHMSRMGYRTKEPVAFPAEKSTLITDVIDAHIHELGYTITDMASLLALTEEEFTEKYLEPKVKLRILK